MTRRAGCGPPKACLELPSQSPCKLRKRRKKKEKTLSGLPSTTRAVRRRASRAGSPPSYAEVGDFAQWVWTREAVVGEKGQADSPGPITKTSFSYSVCLLESARHASSIEAHRASVVAIRPAARKRTRKGYLRLSSSYFNLLTASTMPKSTRCEREIR